MNHPFPTHGLLASQPMYQIHCPPTLIFQLEPARAGSKTPRAGSSGPHPLLLRASQHGPWGQRLAVHALRHQKEKVLGLYRHQRYTTYKVQFHGLMRQKPGYVVRLSKQKGQKSSNGHLISPFEKKTGPPQLLPPPHNQCLHWKNLCSLAHFDTRSS